MRFNLSTLRKIAARAKGFNLALALTLTLTLTLTATDGATAGRVP